MYQMNMNTKATERCVSSFLLHFLAFALFIEVFLFMFVCVRKRMFDKQASGNQKEQKKQKKNNEERRKKKKFTTHVSHFT